MQQTISAPGKSERRKIAPPTIAVALKSHWPEYLMEAAGLGIFMICACVITTLLQHPSSSIAQAIEDPLARRALTGIAMALTLLAIIYSPWGKRSGAHLNPTFTITYLMLGKVQRWDALFYVLAQFTGGIAGVYVAEWIIGPGIRHSSVDYAVTIPGAAGPLTAFWAELCISFLMMTTVLVVSNNNRLSRFTPLCAAVLVAIYITIEAPLSGMSMNPARTFGSGLAAGELTALWIYFIAPPIGMLIAGGLYRFRSGAHRVVCAKFHHHNQQRCIFRCNYGEM